MGERRRDPLFVVGAARSGTTYLADLLVRRGGEVCLAPESNFVINLLSAFGEWPLASDGAVRGALDLMYGERKFHDLKLDRAELERALVEGLPLTFAELVRRTLQLYCERASPGCKVWGLKKGGAYVLQAPRLVEHFPGAKFLHLVRDGRAVFNSQRKAIHTQTGQPFQTDAAKSARQWRECVLGFARFAAERPANCLEVAYEDLMREPDATLKTILDFLGVGAREGEATAYVPERYRYLHANVGGPPKPERVDAWQSELPEEDVRLYEAVAGRELAAKSYALLHGGAAGGYLRRAKLLARRLAAFRQ